MEYFLKIIDHILVHLEGLDENIRINGRIRSKDRICHCDNPKILATETRKGNSIGLSYVELEVNETNWEHKDISLI